MNIWAVNPHTHRFTKYPPGGLRKVSWGGSESGLDEGVPLEPRKPTRFKGPFSKTSIQFRDFSRNIYPFFTIFENPIFFFFFFFWILGKTYPCLGIFLYRMGTMFRDFLWKSDPLERCMSTCLYMRVPTCFLRNKKKCECCWTFLIIVDDFYLHIKKHSYRLFILFSNGTFVAVLTHPVLCAWCMVPVDMYFTFLNDKLMAHNFQKWKSRFPTCPCHKIYWEDAVGLISPNYALKIAIFVSMWNLGQYRENLILCQ